VNDDNCVTTASYNRIDTYARDLSVVNIQSDAVTESFFSFSLQQQLLVLIMSIFVLLANFSKVTLVVQALRK